MWMRFVFAVVETGRMSVASKNPKTTSTSTVVLFQGHLFLLVSIEDFEVWERGIVKILCLLEYPLVKKGLKTHITRVCISWDLHSLPCPIFDIPHPW